MKVESLKKPEVVKRHEEKVKNYLPHADGFIIGSHFKVDGKVENPVDAARVQAFMKEIR